MVWTRTVAVGVFVAVLCLIGMPAANAGDPFAS